MSQKLLCFLVTCCGVVISCSNFAPQKGIGAIFLCAYRFMAAWLYLFARDILRFHSLTLGLVCGYMSHAKEEEILKGVNILITVPCCLRKHLQNTAGVKYENLKYLMIDQVDVILKLNREEELRKVMRILPQTRQTLIFPAAETIKGEDLARPYHFRKLDFTWKWIMERKELLWLLLRMKKEVQIQNA